jgi:multiple sugar transport system ATP-binding protein
VEQLGAEQYAYFQLEHEGVQSDELRELAEDAGADEVPSSGEGQIVARLESASGISRGADAELWLDLTKLQFFDPSDGKNLARSGTSAES